MKNFKRENLLFSLCGLNCGLCPMNLNQYCPGCGGGEGNQSCSIATQALTEYNATAEGKVYLFTGSKVTGGFCVTRKGLLEPSKLGHILTDNPALKNYQTAEGGHTVG